MTRLTDAELAELAAGITQDPWWLNDLVAGRGSVILSGRSIRKRLDHDGAFIKGDAQAIARVPDLLADMIAAREALRGMTAIFEQMLAHPDDTMYDARFWKQIAREGIAKGGA